VIARADRQTMVSHLAGGFVLLCGLIETPVAATALLCRPLRARGSTAGPGFGPLEVPPVRRSGASRHPLLSTMLLAALGLPPREIINESPPGTWGGGTRRHRCSTAGWRAALE